MTEKIKKVPVKAPKPVKSKLCDYCGQRPFVSKIDNPNYEEWDATRFWKVCECCYHVIPIQQKMAMLQFMTHRVKTTLKDPSELTTKWEGEINDMQQQLDKLAEKFRMPIYAAEITVNDGDYEMKETLTLGRNEEYEKTRKR